MGKGVLGVMGGMVTAFVVVLGVELVGLRFFPQPTGMNPTDPASVREHFDQIHIGSFVIVIVAWSLAAFVGPAVANRIAGVSPRWPALVVITLFALLCAYNLVVVPTPRWMIPAAVIMVGMSSMIGYRSRPWARA